MRYYQIVPVGEQRHTNFLIYSSDNNLSQGTIGTISIGNKKSIGVVLKECDKPNFPTKPFSAQDIETLPTQLINLGIWLSQYYSSSLSATFSTILPAGLNKKRRTPKSTPVQVVRRDTSNDQLTDDQHRAVTKINSFEHSSPIILHGVTGSGKTRVYLEITKKTIKSGQNIIILVPEISLTPQITGDFLNIHSNVITLHSQLSESERHQIWQKIQTNRKPVIIIGPRSALFAPVKNVGLIVVDEFHDASYKQDQHPKYDALIVAAKLAELHNSKLIFGSATPGITMYSFARQKKWPIIKMTTPVVTHRREIIKVDMTDKHSFSKNFHISDTLASAVSEALSKGEQSLIFHNRRGSSRSLQCHDCGWIATCPTCHTPLALHHDIEKMKCHLCGLILPIRRQCPECESFNLKFSGFGTKRLESELKKMYPTAKIYRFDTDTPKADNLLAQYQKVLSGDVDIIIGTQIVTKGLDLPRLSVLGIIQADSGLQLPDLYAGERTFQTLYQVVGRVGRKGIDSKVIVQSYQPNNKLITTAIHQNFTAFYKYELDERKALFMPPFSFILKITVAYSNPKTSHDKLHAWTTDIKQSFANILITGPAPAFHEHIGSKYRSTLTIKSVSRKQLQKIIEQLPTNWQFELDPNSLL